MIIPILDQQNANMGLIEQDPRLRRAEPATRTAMRATAAMVSLATAAAATGEVSGLDASTLALGPDTSHWNGPITVASMLPHISYTKPKCADGAQMYAGDPYDLGNFVDRQFHSVLDQSYRAGVACIPYFYFQSKLYQAGEPESDWQYKRLKYAFRNLVPLKSFHGLAIDLEEFGETDTNLKRKVETFYAWLLDDPQFNQVKIEFYTSLGFLNAHPALRDWLSFNGASKDLWLAQWSISGNKIRTSWEELRTKHIPGVNMRVVTPGFAGWQYVQWSNAFYGMAGCGSGEIDLNFYHGTREQCWKSLGFTPAEIPTPPPPPATRKFKAIGGMLIRAGAGHNQKAIGAVRAGEVIEISDTAETVYNGLTYIWGKHSRGWTALSQVRKYCTEQ
jgi:hypothetical protein